MYALFYFMRYFYNKRQLYFSYIKKKQDLCLDPDPDREKEVKRIEKGKRKKITGKKIEVQRFLDDCPSSMVLIKL